jgi:large subunit ribosomal protein L23
MNQERLYTVLLEPHFSEKVSVLGEKQNQYGFKVAKDATKAEIKEAVEKLFKVTVEGVSTATSKARSSAPRAACRGRRIGRRPTCAWRRARKSTSW